MQDLTSSSAAYYHQPMMMITTAKQNQPELPEQELLKCPRCDSPKTKFCYYNNYNLSQPRHFCKNCRRYWTKGGALRKIPVGGGSRKIIKRSASSSSNPKNKTVSEISDDHHSSGKKSEVVEEDRVTGQEMDPPRMLYGLPVGDPIGGSFSSLLASNMQMGGVVYEFGSRWYPGMDSGLCSGLRKSENE